MRHFVVLAGPLLACFATFLALNGCNHPQTLAERAANVKDLHQVTETTFRMDELAVFYCRPPIPERQPPNPHSEAYCHVYVNEAGLKTMKSGRGKYPKGTVIVKQKFSDEEGTTTELFTLMRKMAEGYDPDNGDWEYSTVDSNATTILSRGRIESCIDCHSEYAKTDYVTRKYMNTP